jgi:hypothetical protein
MTSKRTIIVSGLIIAAVFSLAIVSLESRRVTRHREAVAQAKIREEGEAWLKAERLRRQALATLEGQVPAVDSSAALPSLASLQEQQAQSLRNIEATRQRSHEEADAKLRALNVTIGADQR